MRGELNDAGAQRPERARTAFKELAITHEVASFLLIAYVFSVFVVPVLGMQKSSMGVDASIYLGSGIRVDFEKMWLVTSFLGQNPWILIAVLIVGGFEATGRIRATAARVLVLRAVSLLLLVVLLLSHSLKLFLLVH